MILPLTALSLAVTPGTVPVQGALTDAAGAPLTGPATLTVRLYPDGSTGSSAFFTEALTAEVSGGAFSVTLGAAATVLDLDRFGQHPALTLSVEVGGVESPRVPVGWAPRAGWASKAGAADTATNAGLIDGIDGSALLQTTTEIPWSQIDAAVAASWSTAPNAQLLDNLDSTAFLQTSTEIPWSQIDAGVQANVNALVQSQFNAGFSTTGAVAAAGLTATNNLVATSGFVRPGGASGTSCASGTGGALRWTGTQLQLCLPGRDWVDIDRVEGGDIVKAGGTRTWADGTVPTSCLGYKNPEYPKTYTGHTGSGIYRIDPPGVTAAYDVWCEMEIADGGWTYVTDNNHGSASPTNPSATFSEVAGGYHDYEYNLRGNTYDEILVIRASDAVWCNSWGTGGARWVGGGSSMGIAYDTSFYHYNSGDVGYNWIRQPYSISTTCSSCWTTNNTTPSDIAVTEIGDNGRIMMFDPPGASNSYLYVGNFDAFISQAGGCNLPSGGRATWATYVR